MMKAFLIISVCFLVFSIEGKSLNLKTLKKRVFQDYTNIRPEIKGDAGQPLILTDLIKQGKLDEAKSRSVVDGLDTDVESYSGYFTVDEKHNSNIFFWFFPSKNNASSDPVVLWLQGGPGSSSMFGLFVENGPLLLKDGKLGTRETSWNLNHSVIYIDQPAGTGWSFTNGGYASDQDKVATDLYEALRQFFTVFSEYQENDFYVTGESYGGKYVPSICYEIHNRNDKAELKINLKGLAIGNGFTDPIVQIRYSEYVYQHGLIDLNAKNELADQEDKAVKEIEAEQFEDAFYSWNDIVSIIQGLTRLDIYNYLSLSGSAADESEMDEFFSKEEVRKAIHVGNTEFDDALVYEYLEADIPKSMAYKVEELLKHYRVLIYNGQTDLIVPYPLTVAYLQTLKFPGSDEYAVAERGIIYDDEDKSVVAGYVKTGGQLTEVMVRNSGHMVPTDQPRWALQLINKFTRHIPL